MIAKLITRLNLQLKEKLNRFKTANSGIAAVEFALILPLMVLIYAGVVEITHLYAADRKAVVFAHTVADLATQAKVDTVSTLQTISDNNAKLIYGLASAVLYPFKASGATIRLTMVAFDKNVPAAGSASGYVDWEDFCTIGSDGTSCELGTAKARCDRIDVEEGFATANGYTMRSEVTFTYEPILPGLFNFNVTKSLTDTQYTSPRATPVVIRVRPSETTVDGKDSGDKKGVAGACADKDFTR